MSKPKAHLFDISNKEWRTQEKCRIDASLHTQGMLANVKIYKMFSVLLIVLIKQTNFNLFNITYIPIINSIFLNFIQFESYSGILVCLNKGIYVYAA